jgi:hypothetical protein
MWEFDPERAEPRIICPICEPNHPSFVGRIVIVAVPVLSGEVQRRLMRCVTNADHLWNACFVGQPGNIRVEFEVNAFFDDFEYKFSV